MILYPAIDLKGGNVVRRSEHSLRLLHPVIPFVTDELWRALNGFTDSDGALETLALAEWPAPAGHSDPAAVAEVGRLQDLVAELRRFRTQQGIASRRKVDAVVLKDEDFAATWAEQLAALADLTLSAHASDSAPEGWEVLQAGGVSVDILGWGLLGAGGAVKWLLGWVVGAALLWFGWRLASTSLSGKQTIHRALLAETAAIALAGVRRFQFRLLAGRDEVSVFLEVLDDLFADNLALKATQCGLDRLVRVN